MILFAELQMQGDKHVHVNSGVLNILNISGLGTHQIEVYCDDVHRENLLRKVVNNVNLDFSTFTYTGDKELSKNRVVFKIFRETVLAFKIFKRARKCGAECILFASAFPFTSVFLNILSWVFSQKIIICFHGDIGVLSMKKRNKVTTRIFRSVISFFFKSRSQYTTALFYGETIKNNLFCMFPEFKSNNVITIDHPYDYCQFDHIIENEEALIIANIGTGLIGKNSQFLYNLASDQIDNVSQGKVKFLQIGYVSPEVRTYANEYVEIIGDNTFMNFEKFERNLVRADYFVYFFTHNSYYDLCPSGTFFDSIKYQKPIISLRNPFFEYYFNKLGDIGFLCDSMEEMKIIISQIIEGKHKNRYINQVERLISATELLSIGSIAKSFKQQYNEIFR